MSVPLSVLSISREAFNALPEGKFRTSEKGKKKVSIGATQVWKGPYIFNDPKQIVQRLYGRYEKLMKWRASLVPLMEFVYFQDAPNEVYLQMPLLRSHEQPVDGWTTKNRYYGDNKKDFIVTPLAKEFKVVERESLGIFELADWGKDPDSKPIKTNRPRATKLLADQALLQENVREILYYMCVAYILGIGDVHLTNFISNNTLVFAIDFEENRNVEKVNNPDNIYDFLFVKSLPDPESFFFKAATIKVFESVLAKLEKYVAPDAQAEAKYVMLVDAIKVHCKLKPSAALVVQHEKFGPVVPARRPHVISSSSEDDDDNGNPRLENIARDLESDAMDIDHPPSLFNSMLNAFKERNPFVAVGTDTSEEEEEEEGKEEESEEEESEEEEEVFDRRIPQLAPGVASFPFGQMRVSNGFRDAYVRSFSGEPVNVLASGLQKSIRRGEKENALIFLTEFHKFNLTYTSDGKSSSCFGSNGIKRVMVCAPEDISVANAPLVFAVVQFCYNQWKKVKPVNRNLDKLAYYVAALCDSRKTRIQSWYNAVYLSPVGRQVATEMQVPNTDTVDPDYLASPDALAITHRYILVDGTVAAKKGQPQKTVANNEAVLASLAMFKRRLTQAKDTAYYWLHLYRQQCQKLRLSTSVACAGTKSGDPDVLLMQIIIALIPARFQQYVAVFVRVYFDKKSDVPKKLRVNGKTGDERNFMHFLIQVVLNKEKIEAEELVAEGSLDMQKYMRGDYVLSYDASVIKDKHTAAGRHGGKTKSDFVRQGAIVSNEDVRFKNDKFFEVYTRTAEREDAAKAGTKEAEEEEEEDEGEEEEGEDEEEEELKKYHSRKVVRLE
jgi:TATA-binding protein-associated factor Taf7